MYLALFFITSILPKYWASEDKIFSQEFIDSINQNESSWVAGRNWGENTTLEYLHSLCGSFPETLVKNSRRNYKSSSINPEEIPKNFSSYEKWPYCKYIITPREQGNCGGCWAIASAASITDRTCIASNGTKQPFISSEDLLSCCSGDLNGCEGGFVSQAWKCWISEGVVTGGEIFSNQGCKPYSNHTHLYSEPPDCVRKCTNGNYPKSYEEDKQYGVRSVAIGRHTETIQSEILENGPVVTLIKVYDDFFRYKNGVYEPTTAQFSGHYHSVKLIGWGNEEGLNYWLGVNTWGTHWGDQGLFKIKWGQCEVENSVSAGLVSRGWKNSALNVFISVFFTVFKLLLKTCSQ